MKDLTITFPDKPSFKLTASELRGGVCTIFIEAWKFEPQLKLPDEDISHLNSDLFFQGSSHPLTGFAKKKTQQSG